jgi:hypothetical protein
MPSPLEQVRNNLVAIISLLVALTALGYTTWRNERTEINRNTREAGFELLGKIGSLQQIVFYAHFQPGDARGDPRMGWAEALTIVDLADLMPPPVGRDAKALYETWSQEAAGLGENPDAQQRIDHAIDELRQSTLARLRALR